MEFGPPGFSISGEEAVSLRSPLVYVWRRGGRVMYVGASACGAARPFTPGHHRLSGIRRGDELEFHFCFSGEEACRLEQDMIRALSPELNAHPGSGPVGPYPIRTPTSVSRMYCIPIDEILKACALGDLPCEQVRDSWRIGVTDAEQWASDYKRRDPKAMLTVAEASEQYELDESELRSWIRKGALAHYRVGPTGLIRIMRGDLEAAI